MIFHVDNSQNMQPLQFKARLFICFLVLIFNSSQAKTSDTNYIMQLAMQAFEIESEHPDSSLSISRQVLKLSQALHFKKGIAMANIRIGSIYNNRGENDSALFYTYASYKLRNEIHDYKGAANTGLRLSYIYSETGKKDSAFYILYEAIKLNRLAGDSSGISSIYTALGNLSMNYKDTIEASNYFQESVQRAEQLKDSLNIQQAYAGIGSFYLNIQNYTEAVRYFLLESKLLNHLDLQYDLARNRSNLGACQSELHNYTAAQTYFHLALNDYNRLGLKPEKTILLYNMALLFQRTQQIDSAKFYLNESLKLAKEINDPERMAKCLRLLSEIYSALNDYANAYKYHVQYALIRDSITTVEKNKSIAEMQTKYKSDLQEKRIAIQNAQLDYKLKQRNVFIIASFLLLAFLGVAVRQRNNAKKEKNRSESLLLNILPTEVAEELKETGVSVAKQFNDVSVLFTDFVNFTSISEQLSATELVSHIHTCFTAFDEITGRHGLEKIKTIGDAYLAVSGIPNSDSEHAIKAVRAALEIREWIATNQKTFEIRIGINTGSVVAGIVGVKKFAYDIWGDTVNTAARMEQQSEAGKINISGTTFNLIQAKFKCIYRGKIQAKNKGEVDMYFVEGENMPM